MNIPGQVAMRKGLEAEAERNQPPEAKAAGNHTLETVVAGDGTAGIERQIKQMLEMIENKPDAIIVQPTDNAALVPH